MAAVNRLARNVANNAHETLAKLQALFHKVTNTVTNTYDQNNTSRAVAGMR